MADQLRWGILGTGNIANQFADGINGIAGPHRSVLAAVGSRTAASAGAFAEKHRISSAHDSYDALLDDDRVDAIYLSLPNSLHHEWAIKCIEAGKHVLCEKPISVTAAEADEMFDCAQRHGKLLVEAFMYRSHPLTHAVLDAVRSGAVGEVRLIRTSFCYRTKQIDGNVRFDPDLAGGALMDIGCYCLSFARLIAGGEPTAMHATAVMHERGVDENVAGTLAFDGGVLASFVCGMGVQTNNAAIICGTDGFIEVPVPWKPPVTGAAYVVDGMMPPRQDKAAPPKRGREERRVDAPMPLYGLEAEHFADAVLDGAPPAVSRADTVGNMAVLDALRRQIGLPF